MKPWHVEVGSVDELLVDVFALFSAVLSQLIYNACNGNVTITVSWHRCTEYTVISIRKRYINGYAYPHNLHLVQQHKAIWAKPKRTHRDNYLLRFQEMWTLLREIYKKSSRCSENGLTIAVRFGICLWKKKEPPLAWSMSHISEALGNWCFTLTNWSRHGVSCRRRLFWFDILFVIQICAKTSTMCSLARLFMSLGEGEVSL